MQEQEEGEAEGWRKGGREGRRGPGKGHRNTQTQILKGSHRAVPRTELDCKIPRFQGQA